MKLAITQHDIKYAHLLAQKFLPLHHWLYDDLVSQALFHLVQANSEYAYDKGVRRHILICGILTALKHHRAKKRDYDKTVKLNEKMLFAESPLFSDVEHIQDALTFKRQLTAAERLQIKHAFSHLTDREAAAELGISFQRMEQMRKKIIGKCQKILAKANRKRVALTGGTLYVV